MVRPASPLLPARCSFAKVPELGSWALAGAAGHAIGDTPRNSRGSLQVLSQREPRDCADMLQPTALGCCSPLFPALPRDVPTRPARLGDSAQPVCRGDLAHRSLDGWVSFPLSKLWSAGCSVTTLGSLQNHRVDDRSFFTRAILTHMQASGLGLPSSPNCASGHSAPEHVPETSCPFLSRIQTTSERPRWARY